VSDSNITAADLDFANLGTYTVDGADKDGFSVLLLTGEIAGTTELYQGDVFVEIELRPSLMTDAKARELVADAIVRGKTLGMRPAFAAKVRKALECGEAIAK
jgi:hypothetical protein